MKEPCMAQEPSREELQRRIKELEKEAFKLKEAEEALRRAKEWAEDANRTKSEFLANMTHEMRTPMNGVMGMLDLALDSTVPESQREYLLLAQNSARLLLRLIEDVFDFSKMEAGKMGIEETDLRLRDLMDAAMRPLALQAKGKGLELTWKTAPDCPEHLMGDPGRLTQVVFNVVGNAIKFTDAGKVEVSVKVDRTAEEGLMLLFSVRDTGPGIPADRMDDVFKAFTQVDGSRTRRHGGAGLGLSISRKLVEMMGGRIWCESVSGKGTVFHFTVRFREGREVSSCAAEAPGTSHGGEFPAGKVRTAFPRPFSSQTFNVVAALKKAGGQPEALSEAIERFVEDGLASMGVLQESLTSGSPSGLEPIAGELRGMAAKVGADKLADEIFRFELAVRKGDMVRCGRLFISMEQEFDNFKAAALSHNIENSRRKIEQETKR